MRQTKDYTFFWKSKLAQWNMQSFIDNMGIEYNCAEQYMMAKKAKLFNDAETYSLIMKATHPQEQQTLGRKIKNFNQDIWDANATTIVYQGNYYKFSQNKDLLDLLLSTGNRILVEASPIDRIWGVGLAEDNPLINNPVNWKGKNLLGYTLTNLKNNFFIK